MSWHYNPSDLPGDENGTPSHPFNPVHFRLIGTHNSIAAYLNMLETIFELSYVSDPVPSHSGLIRVYGVMHRPHPLRGGER